VIEATGSEPIVVSLRKLDPLLSEAGNWKYEIVDYIAASIHSQRYHQITAQPGLSPHSPSLPPVLGAGAARDADRDFQTTIYRQFFVGVVEICCPTHALYPRHQIIYQCLNPRTGQNREGFVDQVKAVLLVIFDTLICVSHAPEAIDIRGRVGEIRTFVDKSFAHPSMFTKKRAQASQHLSIGDIDSAIIRSDVLC
jgi:hypothetical protein